jgi:hypothetical protein
MEIEIVEQKEPIKEEEVFEKPQKKKRVLTDKQREALAKGRETVKQKRLAKQKEAMEKELAKEKKKEEAKKKREEAKKIKEGLVKQEKERAEAKKDRKTKLAQQEEVRKRIADRERQNKIDQFNVLKYKCLENLEDEDHFDRVDNLLTNYITEDDICGDRPKLLQKVGQLIVDVRKKYS